MTTRKEGLKHSTLLSARCYEQHQLIEKFSASNSCKRKHAPPCDLLKLFTNTKARLKRDTHSKKTQSAHTATKLKKRTPTGPLSPQRPATLPFSLIVPFPQQKAWLVLVVVFSTKMWSSSLVHSGKDKERNLICRTFGRHADSLWLVLYFTFCVVHLPGTNLTPSAIKCLCMQDSWWSSPCLHIQ